MLQAWTSTLTEGRPGGAFQLLRSRERKRVGRHVSSCNLSRWSGCFRQRKMRGFLRDKRNPSHLKYWPELPISCLEILGQSVLGPMVGRLEEAGFGSVSVLADHTLANLLPARLARSGKLGLVRHPDFGAIGGRAVSAPICRRRGRVCPAPASGSLPGIRSGRFLAFASRQSAGVYPALGQAWSARWLGD
jgi:hypothetical protein